MVVYIKKNIKGNYFEIDEPLNPELYINIGETYQDYLNNKWVLLNEDQINFRNENPEASVEEVFAMALTPAYERTLDDAKNDKISQIEAYNVSNNVDSFIVNDTITSWLTVEERLNYKQSVEAAKLMNIEKLSFFIEDYRMEVTLDQAEQMLAMIQLYADECFMVTKQHKINVKALETVEEVDNYDHTSGYPEQLKFNLM